MLQLSVAIALITLGFVAPCLIDVARTPREDFDLPSKQTWLVVVIAFWAFGAAAWLLAGRRDVRMRHLWSEAAGSRAFSQGQALRRHPAHRPADLDYAQAGLAPRRPAAAMTTTFIAPDDNPEFLQELDRRIQQWRDETGR